MVPMEIESLVIGMIPSPSMLSLRVRKDGPAEYAGRSLPIWVGPIEALSIAATLDERQTERPLTHELSSTMVAALGGEISRVVIDRVEGALFFATLYLRTQSGMFVKIDARPSDAIALASANKIPLFVEESVLAAASVPSSFKPGFNIRK